MVKTDVLIIGAGLLGCFTARSLTRYQADVIVLEEKCDVCRGISKANTGIIYSGYNNRPGSEKQKLCVQANEDFDRLAGELEVPFVRPGSLMVAYGPRGDAVIRRKYADGLKGGVRELKLLTGDEAQTMEPSLAEGITSALYSPSTGTVDPWELCIAAYENACSNGAKFIFNSRAEAVRRENGGFTVETPDEIYFAKALVNAAGLSSDKVRELCEKPYIRIFPTAADYIVLDKGSGSIVSHIILHEGEDGKGLTLVPTAGGNLLVGPTNREASPDETALRDMRTDKAGLDKLKELCREVIPGLDLDKQIRTFGSLRPDPYYVSEHDGSIIKEEKSIKDIQIIEEDGLFSLIGIKTPGLTFSGELGRIVAEKAASHAGITDVNERFDPHRPAIVRARDLDYEERAVLAAEDPAYGEIVCACMDVTKAEVRQAVRRGAPDFEGVKRRTGAGFGKCQGSRCRRRIKDIIDETGSAGQ